MMDEPPTAWLLQYVLLQQKTASQVREPPPPQTTLWAQLSPLGSEPLALRGEVRLPPDHALGSLPPFTSPNPLHLLRITVCLLSLTPKPDGGRTGIGTHGF